MPALALIPAHTPRRHDQNRLACGTACITSSSNSGPLWYTHTHARIPRSPRECSACGSHSAIAFAGSPYRAMTTSSSRAPASHGCNLCGLRIGADAAAVAATESERPPREPCAAAGVAAAAAAAAAANSMERAASPAASAESAPVLQAAAAATSLPATLPAPDDSCAAAPCRLSLCAATPCTTSRRAASPFTSPACKAPPCTTAACAATPLTSPPCTTAPYEPSPCKSSARARGSNIAIAAATSISNSMANVPRGHCLRLCAAVRTPPAERTAAQCMGAMPCMRASLLLRMPVCVGTRAGPQHSARRPGHGSRRSVAAPKARRWLAGGRVHKRGADRVRAGISPDAPYLRPRRRAPAKAAPEMPRHAAVEPSTARRRTRRDRAR
eukprot:357613-Chlamydomonas_euryale.AAC.5